MATGSPYQFVTCGEPAGIGPELLIQYVHSNYEPGLIAVANVELLKDRAKQLSLAINIHALRQGEPIETITGALPVIDVPLINKVNCGQLDPANAEYVLATLRTAVEYCQQYPGSALVTGPLHKGVINEAGIPFTGHTEYLADLTHSKQVVMMLACPGLRVALVTTHLPLRDISATITREKLSSVIQVLDHDLKTRFKITRPRILVCGLNPHAGEDGHLGREEIDIIQPVLSELRNKDIHLIGPLPADTLFIPKYLEQADAVLAMYHDQGLPVLKHMGFGKAVNITLGLPFIRTSVDHGTALELAGTGQANTGSLEAALDAAKALM
ncbi:MAG: 4-hydroxythreonine-4-phosphate dehydrogenase PdxA [Gammaproteobacteria bacterium]|nr:4-hydroxythreonine-4-phosphate dehydrogenase PdxA [Gammaproteobacteria bacterium]